MNRPRAKNLFSSTIRNFVFVLVGAFAVAALLYAGLSAASDALISSYIQNTHFVQKETSQVLQSLQAFITENKVDSSKTRKLDKWVKDKKYAHLIVFRDTVKIYDSDAPSSLGKASDYQDGAVYAPNYAVSLIDGKAPIFLELYQEYKFFEIATVIQLILSFMVFTAIVVFFVGRHLAYINQIVLGVEILEGGNLCHEIPVRGEDELATLAMSLNEMRKAFIRKGEKGYNSDKRESENLSAISHDLRTPLTTLILFIEIIKTKKNLTEEERDHYIQKLSVIAAKIKLISENLGDFASDDQGYSVTLDKPQPVRAILDQTLAEAMLFLKEREFRVVKVIHADQERIRVNNHFIYRIIDNVVSNIDRYASHEAPVFVIAKRAHDNVTLAFVNSVAPLTEPQPSSKLGLSLVGEMMRKMGGACVVKASAHRFKITLSFPIIKE